MGYYFNVNYNINPITFSQTTLNSYNHLIEEVAIVDSKHFIEKIYKTTDFQLINNIKKRDLNTNFKFRNKYNFPIQISFFHHNLENENYSFI